MTLKEARAKAGLTQLQLAAKSRVSISTISRAENGYVPYPAHRQALGLALDVWHEAIWPEKIR